MWGQVIGAWNRVGRGALGESCELRWLQPASLAGERAGVAQAGGSLSSARWAPLPCCRVQYLRRLL